MRFNLRWLLKYVDLDIPLKDILDGLTMSGLEVEEFIDLGWDSGLIVVGEIVEIQPHSKARKLSICKVQASTDPETEPLRIVCGAPDLKVGDKAPCALPGAILPDGRRIEKAAIRDEPSEGMLCSGAELYWNDDPSVLLQLGKAMQTGEPFDALIDIGITPNRPDCLSVLGVARDLAAFFQKPFHPPSFRCNETADTTASLAEITLEDKEGCPRYTARICRDIKVGPSPRWLARAVEAAGLRPINNIVDVTNYVLMEYGHPLHAFDLETVDDNHIIVRSARAGEMLRTLDGVKRTLSAEDLVIADPGKAIALAGVMGGENTEIGEKTETVLLESAYFDPIRIRRTRKRHDIQTDASYRFERGTDRENIHIPLNRAAFLIREVAGGEITKGFIDATGARSRPQPLSLRIARTNAILGVEIEASRIADYLVALQCEIVNSTREQLVVLPPSHRVDLKREIDLIEEVGRLYGYDRIDATIPRISSHPVDLTPIQRTRRELSAAFVAEGLSEIITYSFTDSESIEQSRQATDGVVEMMNPLAQTQSVLRTSLVTTMLNALAYNHKRANLDLALWEISDVYRLTGGDEEPFAEREQAVVALTGQAPSGWDQHARPWDFYDLKGMVERILLRLGIEWDRIDFARDAHYHPGRSANLFRGKTLLGRIGQLHPNVAEAFDLRGEVFLGEFDLATLSNLVGRGGVFRSITPYPAVQRDLALVVDDDVPAAAIEKALFETAGDLLESIHLFDVYAGEHVGTGKRSLAYSLTFRSPERTLTDDEINAIQSRLIEAVARKHAAELRTS